MKKILILVGTISASFAMAQVGINTATPQTTLDISAKNATGTTTNVDGFLAPRVTRQRAQNMTGVPTSTMIYINNISTGTQTGTTINVDAVGYYYFNGTIWVKLDNPSNKSSSVNIYNSNGTLESNRTVAQDNNTLAFTSTATTGTNHFSVDGNTFSVNAANHRIGLGTTNPQNKLDLGTDVGSTITDATGKKLAVYNNAGGTSFYGLGVSPARLQFHASSAATDAPGAVLASNGNFGIGTTDPTNILDVRSTSAGAVKIVDGTQGASKVLTSDANGVATWQNIPASTNTNIYNSNGTLTGNRVVTQNANTLAFTGSAVNSFSVDGATLSVDGANDRLGIGTANPETKLHVISSATPNSYRYNLIDAPATTGNGVILALRNTSPMASGNMSLLGFTNSGTTSGGANWAIGSSRTANSEDFYFGNSTGGALIERVRIKGDTGNVGIGTNAPTTKLHVNSSSPAVRIVDGTQGAGKVLTSDANGNASWVTNNTSNPVVMSSMGPGVTLNASIAGTEGTNTGTTITLPPNSKYVVICYMLVRVKNPVPSNGYGWIQSTFTESPSSNTHSSDIQGSYFISGAIIPNQNTFSMISGSIIINNTTSSPKTYYYRVRISNSTNLGAGNEITSFGGTAWGENNLYAVPIN